MKTMKLILFYALSALSLFFSGVATLKYISLVSTIRGMSFSKPVTISKYRELTDFEKLTHNLSDIRYDLYHDSETTFKLLAILFFFVFCISLYSGIKENKIK